jgi:hypothetical protein
MGLFGIILDKLGPGPGDRDLRTDAAGDAEATSPGICSTESPVLDHTLAMNLIDLVSRMGGLQSIATELGVSEADAARGVEALSPAVLGGFKKQAQAQPAGVQGLEGLLARLGGGELAADVLAPRPTNVNRGNEVLGQIFGSKDVSRTVAQNAAARSGLDPALLKKMLPMIAMLIGGSLAQGGAAGGQRPQAGGGLGDMLGSVLGGQASAGRPGGGALAGLASMLDMDGDGNPLDDILRMAGRK